MNAPSMPDKNLTRWARTEAHGWRRNRDSTRPRLASTKAPGGAAGAWAHAFAPAAAARALTDRRARTSPWRGKRLPGSRDRRCALYWRSGWREYAAIDP